MIESKLGQRLFGLCLVILAGGFTIWSWFEASTEGYYFRKAAVVFPAIAVLGLAMLFYPIDVEQMRAQHGVDKPQKFAHYPPEWKVLFFLALAAGFANWYLISH